MARALLLLAAVAAVVVAVSRAGDDRACSRAQREALAFQLRTGAGRGLDPARIARETQNSCTGATALAAVSSGLLQGGAVNPAAELARTATNRDPQDDRGWRALAAVLEQRGDLIGAGLAREHAGRLNPPRPAPG